MEWEYITRVLEENYISKREELDRLGKDGWELVSVDNDIAYLKRPVKSVRDATPGYSYETVEDGYVIFDAIGERVEPYELTKILDAVIILLGAFD